MTPYKSHIKELYSSDLPDDSPWGKNEEIYLPDGREFIVDRWDLRSNTIEYGNVYKLSDYQDENGNRKLNPIPINVDANLDAEIVKDIAKTHNLAIGDDDEFDPSYASKSSISPFATRPPRGNLNEKQYINLKQLLENNDINGEFYNIGHDFSEFKHSMDSTTEQLKQKFQTAIGEKLNGKRISANASRGYHQPLKQYQFDVSNVTISDPYNKGEQVIVAHDMHTAKPKEYFLDTKSQIKILGPATGQASPQKGANPAQVPHKEPITPVQPTNQLKETEKTDDGQKKQHAAYSIESIVEDISPWLPLLLKKKETPLLDFVKKIGWTSEQENGVITSVFEIQVPTSDLKYKLEKSKLENFIIGKSKSTLKVTRLDLDKTKNEYNIIIKKLWRK